MKSRMIILMCILTVSFYSFDSITQDKITAIGTYDGYEYDMYSFTIPAKDDSETDTVVAFKDIPEDILKSFDLRSEALVGVDFEITYEVMRTDGDEEEDMAEEEFTLIALKKAPTKK